MGTLKVLQTKETKKKDCVEFVCFVCFFGFEVPQFECLCFHSNFVESEVSEVLKYVCWICQCVLRHTV